MSMGKLYLFVCWQNCIQNLRERMQPLDFHQVVQKNKIGEVGK